MCVLATRACREDESLIASSPTLEVSTHWITHPDVTIRRRRKGEAEHRGDVLPRWRRESEETVSLGRLPVSAALCLACRPRALGIPESCVVWPRRSSALRGAKEGVLGEAASAVAVAAARAVGTRASASWEEGRAAGAREDWLELSLRCCRACSGQARGVSSWVVKEPLTTRESGRGVPAPLHLQGTWKEPHRRLSLQVSVIREQRKQLVCVPIPVASSSLFLVYLLKHLQVNIPPELESLRGQL